MKTRFKAVNVRLALSETNNALAKLYGSKSQVDKVMGRWLRDAGQER